MTTPEPMPLWKALQLADHVSPTRPKRTPP